MVQSFNKFQSFLLNCAGVDIPTMQECTSAEAKKYKIIGVTVLIPTVLAFFTGGYAIYKITKSFTAAVIFAFLWSWIIFTIDRAIVSNTTSSKITPGFFGRIILAFFISILISQPIEVLIFQDVIEEKREVDKRENEKLATIYIDSLIIVEDSKIVSLDSIVEERRLEYRKEATEGNSSVGRRSGVGRVARLLERQVEEAKAEAAIKKIKINGEIDSLRSVRSEIVSIIKSSYPDGIIGDIELLYQIGENNKVIRKSMIFFFFFFLILEIIPILIKMGSMSKGPDLYNQIKAKIEETVVQAKNNNHSNTLSSFQEQQLQLLKLRTQKVDSVISKKTFSEAFNDYKFYLNISGETAILKEESQSELINRIKDEAIREQLINRLFLIYEKYSEKLDSTIHDSLDEKEK